MTKFTFTAIYKDGTRIELSEKLSYDDIPREDLVAFETSIQKSKLFTLHLEKDQKLIYRARRAIKIGVDPEKMKVPQIYLIGWRQKVGGKDVQSITYICDWIGRGFQIHQAGKFNEKHDWFYSPNLQINEAFEGERYYDAKNKLWKTK